MCNTTRQNPRCDNIDKPTCDSMVRRGRAAILHTHHAHTKSCHVDAFVVEVHGCSHRGHHRKGERKEQEPGSVGALVTLGPETVGLRAALRKGRGQRERRVVAVYVWGGGGRGE